MTLYQKFKKLNIDFDAIGFMQDACDVKYFCTPRGARVIGRAGVDGIHYCFVRGQEEMVFAVNPMSTRYVMPIARTFEDLLRLLLACGSMDAIEQAHLWDKEQFDEYLEANPPTAEAMAVFDVLREKLAITPMEEPFTYLRRLQDSYNYGQLNYSKEYYEMLDATPANDVPSQWKVTMEGDFRAERGKAGQEIPVGKQVSWGDELWHIPAVYLCSGGLVIDFCIQVDTQRIRDYFQKVRAMEEQGIRVNHELRRSMARENPTDISFHPEVIMNGETLRNKRGRGTAYIDRSIVGEENWENAEGKWILEHYGLPLERAWVIHRCTFPWDGRRKVELKSLTLHLERKKTDIPVFSFQTPEVGCSVQFTHPVTGVEHTLTVQETESQEVDANRFRNEDMDFPQHFLVMGYTIFPDLPNDAFMLKDCAEGDRPRPKNTSGGMVAVSMGVVAMIHSKDGPTQYMVDGNALPGHAAASSLHFEPVTEPVEWRLSVREKLMADVDVTLI